MNTEAQILVSLLGYGTQFLAPISEEDSTQLAHSLVDGARSLFVELDWSDDRLLGLLKKWFHKGRVYEGGAFALLAPVSSRVDTALDAIIAHEIETLFEPLSTNQEVLCQFLWLWFQRGRSYQRGNAVVEYV